MKSLLDFWIQKINFKFKITAVLSLFVGIILMLFFVYAGHGQALTSLNTEELIKLTNQVRLDYYLTPLSLNHKLQNAAVAKARAIIKKQDFSHNLSGQKNFSDWVKEEGYEYTIIGENLATGFNNNEAVVKAWLNSPKHRDNILNPKYQEIGLAMVKGELDGQITYIIVQYLGATDNLLISENLMPYSAVKINDLLLALI